MKAPLDETNISPSQVIDDLTNSDNVCKSNSAVGFIDETPVFFVYVDNILRIEFLKAADLLEHKCDIENYIKDISENTENITVCCTYATNFVILRFFWEEEE